VHRTGSLAFHRASLKAMARNPLAMIVRAALLVGMVVVIPLLGHATWHAYRELVSWRCIPSPGHPMMHCHE
jgi:uncharacterized membrane protein